MKAVVLSKYGSPENLRFEELDTPRPRSDEVLVKVHATAVNDWDWCFVRGQPLLYRLMFGLLKPKVSVLGAEVAGTVVELGGRATKYQPGDRVYGDISQAGFGGFAEFVAVREEALTRMPAAMSYEQAASLPHAAMLALQGLVDVGGIRRNERVLINGAGGGVGTIGVQIAKQYGAEVTGVDSSEKLATMRSVGFDHVMDYTQQDFTRAGKRYDLILDTKTSRSPFDYLRALEPGGRYVTVGGHLHRLLQVLLLGRAISRFSRKEIRIVNLKPNKDLEEINRAFETVGLRSVIDGPYSLRDLPKAVQRFGEAKHVGKIVVRVTP